MNKVILKVEGMSCSACSNHVEKYLKKQKGIIQVSVNLILGQALIYYEDDIDIETLGHYIQASGYQYGGVYDERKETKKENGKLSLLLLGILLLLILYISMSHMFHLKAIPFIDKMKNPSRYAVCLCLLSIPYLFYGGDILKKGIKNLFHRSANMDTLVALGVLTSFIYSFVNMILVLLGHKMFVEYLYFESVCMILFFVKLGRYIDKNSKEKTKEAIQELVQVTPESALLKTKEGEKEVTIDEVKVGDHLIVKPGMKVAVDGKIIKGSAHFEESFITGESTPIKKGKGDSIVAGSINYDGVVLYQAEKIGPQSTISEMVHLVLEASNSKMPISKIADRVSSYFVPVIIGIAIFTFLLSFLFGISFDRSLLRMVTVLLVACPCALGLATPLAVVVSIGNAARKGILIKNSETLETASHIDTIVFDKTGTLTYGKLSVSQFYNDSKYEDQVFFNIVANIEKNSTHPIAKAFVSYQTNSLEVEAYNEQPGLGITAKIGKKTYALGNSKILKSIPNDHKKEEEALAQSGHSIFYVLEDQKIIGLIGVKDILKEESKETIQQLKRSKMEIVMLTGDNEITAQQIGKELGIKQIVSNVLPQDKTEYIKKLQASGKKVAMVGDGINDAPSLATAEIGISFKKGTDIAANSSDVILTSDRMDSILTFFVIGKKTLVNIKQNLFWAFFYNLLMIPLAIGIIRPFGLEMSPMIASLAMMLSSLCVVMNALRVRNIGKR